MATPWISAIKQTKQLTVFPGPDLRDAPAWGGGLFKRILEEFNKLSSVHKLGVTLVASNTPPARKGPGGANVQIEISVGTHKFFFDDIERTSSLPGTGIDLAGVTNAPNLAEQIKAFIFVPVNPTVGGASSRGVGNGVKLAIALHEAVHACGLSEAEHSPGNNPDLFMTGGSLSAQFPPDGVPGDRIQLSRSTFVPPLFISPRTARLIQANWT
jgi:hypothetical protein